MGNDTSKEIREIADMLEEDKVCLTPINQFSCRNFSIDPRSPTEGIVRTPIEIRKEAFDTHAEVHPLRRRWKSEPDISPWGKEKYFKTNLHIIKDDPRSPTFGIVRTPIHVFCNKENSYDKCLKNSEHDDLQTVTTNAQVKNIVEDCRSPSLGISRTPIQVSATPLNEEVTLVTGSISNETGTEKTINTTPLKPWLTPLSTKFGGSGSFVYTDDEGSDDLNTKKSVKIIEFDGNNEKENDVNLKRKLVFTPEQKTGIKVRTPLSSRCNFQDSPSQYLKIMQVQKLGHDVGISVDNIPNTASVPMITSQKKNVIVDWDKDSTLIM